MDDLSKEIKKKIKEAQKQFKGQLSNKELAQAIYDIYQSRHGYEGQLEDVLPKKPDGYWTKEALKESALKYTSKTDWEKGEPSAYNIALRNGWIDECCAHMEELLKPKGYWTLERCQESALKYQTKPEWKKNEPTAYSKAKSQGWVDLCCAHMKVLRRPNGSWTLEECIESASRYETSTAWAKGHGAAYQAARKHKWLDECRTHMKPKGKGK